MVRSVEIRFTSRRIIQCYSTQARNSTNYTYNGLKVSPTFLGGERKKSKVRSEICITSKLNQTFQLFAESLARVTDNSAE